MSPVTFSYVTLFQCTRGYGQATCDKAQKGGLFEDRWREEQDDDQRHGHVEHTRSVAAHLQQAPPTRHLFLHEEVNVL